MKRVLSFFCLSVCLSSCIASVEAIVSVDDSLPEIEFMINNLETGQRSNTTDLYLSATAGDCIELSVKSLEYKLYPQNTFSLILFNVEKIFENQESCIFRIIVPDGISGVFPATAEYTRILRSTSNDKQVGLYNDRSMTLYIKVLESHE